MVKAEVDICDTCKKNMSNLKCDFTGEDICAGCARVIKIFANLDGNVMIKSFPYRRATPGAVAVVPIKGNKVTSWKHTNKIASIFKEEATKQKVYEIIKAGLLVEGL